MLKKEITYTDYDGNERTETFMFNLSKAELIELQLSEKGGLQNFIQQVVQERDTKKLSELFRSLIMKAYGQKSADGRQFIKSEQLSKEFSETEAFSDLLVSLYTNAEGAAEFIKGLVPQSIADQLK